LRQHHAEELVVAQVALFQQPAEGRSVIDDFVTIDWTKDGAIRLIDQTRLPLDEVYVECRTVEEVARAIRTMQIRGAPAIGIAAAMGLAMGAGTIAAPDFSALYTALESMGDHLMRTRPTAVNLAWAVRRILRRAQGLRERPLSEIPGRLVAEATAMREEDIGTNRAIGKYGQELVPNPARILTHCNAGGLATAGYGTAVGVIRAAVEAGKRIKVWVDETRPLLQGARLTAWELSRAGIPATLITDNMAGHFMQRGEVDLVVVGADRIARNGDTANKIGTYSVAILARAHAIPFYVAAPVSTLDMSLPRGLEIPIEVRAPEEVTEIRGLRVAPGGMQAANPAFDVTPASYVDGIITERGIARAPYEESLPRLAGDV
jgi:methylthioribose-1-phosphate isomerase